MLTCSLLMLLVVVALPFFTLVNEDNVGIVVFDIGDGTAAAASGCGFKIANDDVNMLG